MLSSLIRKIHQLQADPVLRRWLIGRALGRWPGEPAFTPHRPLYLDDLLPLKPESPSHDFTGSLHSQPAEPLTLELAGETVHVEMGSEAKLFQRPFDDIEALLSLHRFSWISSSTDPAWVGVLWRAWREEFSVPSASLAWHPYTVGERAVNILRFARRYGLPGPPEETLSVLAAHVSAIADRLEYFGDHHTSNHLANNGRGLFVLGLELNLAKATDLGVRILLEEAKRLFTPTGLLREGSSHYHLLYLRLYETAAKAAEQAGRPEAPALRAISVKAREAAQMLVLPGGLPLIGDISPDIPPATLLALLDVGPGVDIPSRCCDGWLRFQSDSWSGLWHASPEGFSHMPGHGHQDTGGFELHFEDEPVFIDPGRSSYGERGEAALYRSAMMHNALMMDGKAPFPTNRPYYDDAFRRRIGGPQLELSATQGGVTLTHHGFARFPHGGRHRRSWMFDGPRMTLQDTLEGRGRTSVNRTLITPLAPEPANGGIVLRGRKAIYTIDTGDDGVTIEPVTSWRAYGRGEPAHALRIKRNAPLPFKGSITLEAVANAARE